jgi:hypothetical protein
MSGGGSNKTEIKFPKEYGQALAQLTSMGKKAEKYADIVAEGRENPEFLSKALELEGRATGDYADSIRQGLIAHTRSLAKGGPGLFTSPERVDETRDKLMNRFQYDLPRLADEEARNIYLYGSNMLTGASNIVNTVANRYGAMGQVQDGGYSPGFNDYLGSFTSALSAMKGMGGGGSALSSGSGIGGNLGRIGYSSGQMGGNGMMVGGV